MDEAETSVAAGGLSFHVFRELGRLIMQLVGRVTTPVVGASWSCWSSGLSERDNGRM